MSRPYSRVELRQLADLLEEWEELLLDPKRDGYKQIADRLDEIPLRRDGVFPEIAGHIILEDGWLGFRFAAPDPEPEHGH